MNCETFLVEKNFIQGGEKETSVIIKNENWLRWDEKKKEKRMILSERKGDPLEKERWSSLKRKMILLEKNKNLIRWDEMKRSKKKGWSSRKGKKIL